MLSFCRILLFYCLFFNDKFVTHVEIKMFDNFTEHQSTNTAKLRRVQKFEWEREVLNKGIRSNENWKGLLPHVQYEDKFAIHVLWWSSFVGNVFTYGTMLSTSGCKWLTAHDAWFPMIHVCHKIQFCTKLTNIALSTH